MLTAFCRAFYALSTPPLRRIVALSLALAVLTFASGMVVALVMRERSPSVLDPAKPAV